jgi:TetR/AcrR family transcriptional regulator, transcriptional repressor for nem operon
MMSIIIVYGWPISPPLSSGDAALRLTKDQAEANRQRILREAGQLFRERGFDGIGLAEIMQAAGFTHGGFYNHFDSKSELMAAVTNDVLMSARDKLNARTDAKNGPKSETFAAYVDGYLSCAARDNPRRACPLPSLAQDVARQDGEVRSAFADGLRSYLDAFAEALPQDNRETTEPDPKALREKALASLAALIGGLLMARAVAGVDEAFSRDILESIGTTVKNACSQSDDPHN